MSKQPQPGIARHLAKDQARARVDLARPFAQIQRVAHPTDLHAALGLVALAEEHEGAAVASGAGDDVHPRRAVAVAAAALLHQERVGRHKDRRHARRSHRGAHFARVAVAFEQRQRLLQIPLRRVGDARVGPRRHLVGERRLHVVAVLEVLRGGEVARLDDAALIGQRRRHVVDAVHGDRVKALAAHDPALLRRVRRHLCAAGDVLLHAGGINCRLHGLLLSKSCEGRGARGDPSHHPPVPIGNAVDVLTSEKTRLVWMRATPGIGVSFSMTSRSSSWRLRTAILSR
jgi:hypothetical protein